MSAPSLSDLRTHEEELVEKEQALKQDARELRRELKQVQARIEWMATMDRLGFKPRALRKREVTAIRRFLTQGAGAHICMNDELRRSLSDKGFTFVGVLGARGITHNLPTRMNGHLKRKRGFELRLVSSKTRDGMGPFVSTSTHNQVHYAWIPVPDILKACTELGIPVHSKYHINS